MPESLRPTPNRFSYDELVGLLAVIVRDLGNGEVAYDWRTIQHAAAGDLVLTVIQSDHFNERNTITIQSRARRKIVVEVAEGEELPDIIELIKDGMTLDTVRIKR